MCENEIKRLKRYEECLLGGGKTLFLGFRNKLNGLKVEFDD